MSVNPCLDIKCLKVDSFVQAVLKETQNSFCCSARPNFLRLTAEGPHPTMSRFGVSSVVSSQTSRTHALAINSLLFALQAFVPETKCLAVPNPRLAGTPGTDC